MATVAELIDKIAELEAFRDAVILAARDPAKSAAVARLSTTDEVAAKLGDEPVRPRPVRPSSIASHP